MKIKQEVYNLIVKSVISFILNVFDSFLIKPLVCIDFFFK